MLEAGPTCPVLAHASSCGDHICRGGPWPGDALFGDGVDESVFLGTGRRKRRTHQGGRGQSGTNRSGELHGRFHCHSFSEKCLDIPHRCMAADCWGGFRSKSLYGTRTAAVRRMKCTFSIVVVVVLWLLSPFIIFCPAECPLFGRRFPDSRLARHGGGHVCAMACHGAMP